ncbi:hypothetical protein CI238_08969, partial [Colletotrichum incanum]
LPRRPVSSIFLSVFPLGLEVAPVAVELEIRLVLAVAHQLQPVKLGAGVGLRPQADGQGVASPVVEHAWRNREPRLRADVRDELAVLVPVDPKHDACDGAGGRGELEAEGCVEVRVDVEREVGDVETDACARETVQGGFRFPRGTGGREAGKMPAQALRVETPLVHGPTDWVDVCLAAGSTRELPQLETRVGTCAAGLQLSTEDAARVVDALRCARLVVPVVVDNDRYDIVRLAKRPPRENERLVGRRRRRGSDVAPKELPVDPRRPAERQTARGSDVDGRGVGAVKIAAVDLGTRIEAIVGTVQHRQSDGDVRVRRGCLVADRPAEVVVVGRRFGEGFGGTPVLQLREGYSAALGTRDLHGEGAVRGLGGSQALAVPVDSLDGLVADVSLQDGRPVAVAGDMKNAMGDAGAPDEVRAEDEKLLAGLDGRVGRCRRSPKSPCRLLLEEVHQSAVGELDHR